MNNDSLIKIENYRLAREEAPWFCDAVCAVLLLLWWIVQNSSVGFSSALNFQRIGWYHSHPSRFNCSLALVDWLDLWTASTRKLTASSFHQSMWMNLWRVVTDNYFNPVNPIFCKQIFTTFQIEMPHCSVNNGKEGLNSTMWSMMWL